MPILDVACALAVVCVRLGGIQLPNTNATRPDPLDPNGKLDMAAQVDT